MDGLVSLAPVLAPLFGMIGALGGAWLVYRQTRRKTDSDAQVAAVKTVTDGFTSLLEQQRAAANQTLERMASLEAKYSDLERRVEHLQEEQRQWRRWKAAAIEYIHILRDLLSRGIPHPPPPEPPDEIAADIADRDSS
ncbi:hypothetical protein [Streptomyces sp. NEAU-174]|uniref:hypothetical protein n=1 Tax=Streptomyces sp. NEAU-174 TaxID=3458254 RepID=UPI00044E6101|nr:hypothetical protein Z951_03130 [Streptomyces sp. PRh5]